MVLHLYLYNLWSGGRAMGQEADEEESSANKKVGWGESQHAIKAASAVHNGTFMKGEKKRNYITRHSLYNIIKSSLLGLSAFLHK